VVATASLSDIEQVVTRLSQKFSEIIECHRISILRSGKEISLSFHCIMAADMPISRAHEITSQAEDELRRYFPELSRVVIHVEPQESMR
jgi:divalent metal cation (Fe/Co/Zn/Cd) transporter